MLWNLFGGYLVCLPYGRKKYFLIWLLSRLSALGEGLIY